MGFVKVVKTPAYYKRFQVKFKRRREAKTDYYARQRLIIQDKNKYKTRKYRLVVRITNRDIIAQVFYADMTHDECLVAAYSHELPRYGIALGLTNYAAAYATGLLLARRLNAKMGLSYEGTTEVDGTDYNVEPEGDKKPFKAYLDVGLARTTTGARIFGVLKGACDGGIDVPHNDRRFPGSKRADGQWSSDPEVHRKYIFGGHVADWLRQVQEDEDLKAKNQFSRYIEAGIGADDLEGIYTEAHKAIRADPFKKRDPLDLGYFQKREKAKDANYKPKKRYYGPQKISAAQRYNRIKQKLQAKGLVAIKAQREQEAAALKAAGVKA